MIVPVVILGALGVAFGVPGAGKSLRGLFAFSRSGVDVLNFTAKPSNLPVTVVERGTLESSQNKDVLCEVEGSTTIISIRPEGTRVTKGQLVCKLDSSALQDNLKNQKIATLGAEAAYQNAKLTREVAEIAVTEYVEGIYKQDLETVKGEIALADSERKRAEDRVAWSNRMYQKGYVSKAQNIADQVSLQQKIFSFEQAQTKLNVLEKYTKDKTIKELKSEVEKTRSDELAKKQTWELEKDKEAKLEKQIKNCKLFAPDDGLVVYANDPNRFGGANQVQIEEGAAVRERQKIFSLPNIDLMRVNTKVHESMVDRIRPGLRARVRVDSFAEAVLTGSVQDVAPLPDPNSFFSSDVKVYTTHITIEKGLSGLRPGMSAQVEILVTELENVLDVPVQAILDFRGKSHVAVKNPNGYEWRDVELGLSNDKLVEVKKGLKSGEVVALSPIALMSEEEKREAFGASGKGATKQGWGSAPPGQAGSSPVARGGPAGAGGPGGGPEGKGQGKGQSKGQRKGSGGMGPAFAQKFQNIPPEDQQRLRGASEDERQRILKSAGFTDEEIERMQQMRAGGGGFGGRGGFGGPPGGGGGPSQ